MPRRSIHDVTTRPVKAVKRRATLGLLPAELLSAGSAHFVERVSDAFTANDYEIDVGDGGVVMDVVSRLNILRGWSYDFATNGTVRFSMKRTRQLLVFDGLRVLDANEAVLGELRQQPTAFSVHFDAVDAAGQHRFSVHQPEDEWRRFDLSGPAGQLAVVTRTDRSPARRRPKKGTAVDAFELAFVGAPDELDRVLCLAAAVFVDRLYFSSGDNTSDRLLSDDRERD